jgi:predicted outer membrane repeat protein
MKKMVLTILCLLMTIPAYTHTIIVSPDGSGDYPTVQDAIDASYNGDVIVLNPGTYTGDGNRDIDFLGKAITVQSTDPNDPNIVAATIIDCNSTFFDRYRGFIFQSGEDSNSILLGLTITRGFADYGGAIYCVDSSPVVANCIVNSNFVISKGGGIYSLNSDLILKGCTIKSNKALSSEGGGVCCEHSNVKVLYCNISDNTSRSFGGGIYSDNAYLILTECIINNNEADYYGGGILSSGDSILVAEKSKLYGNYALLGGGIGSSTSKIELSGCIIKNNRSLESGGGIHLESGRGGSKIKDTLIVGNYAGSHGGGLHALLDSYTDQLTISNCTITENRANFPGGGVCAICYGIKFSNCIIWNNTASKGQQFAAIGLTVYVQKAYIYYSDLQGVCSDIYKIEKCAIYCLNNILSKPCFVNPGYWNPNGTPSDANDDFWVEGDYHLLEDSPCINTGDPSYVPEPNETDLDGNPRVVGGRIDMGAYEFNPIKAQMQITPNTLNCKSKGNWIKAHINLPEEILPEEIDVNTPAVLEPFGIESEYIEIIGGDAGPVQIEIGFDRQNFCEAADEEGLWEINLWGRLKSGRYFYGQGRVLIMGRGR